MVNWSGCLGRRSVRAYPSSCGELELIDSWELERERVGVLVGKAKLAAEEWVRCEGSALPGFQGAFLAGSVTTLPDEVPLPESSDVDISVVMEEPPPVKAGKFRFRGALLEVSYEARERLRTPETVLRDPHLAGGIRGMHIVADPLGRLASLQSEVARKYALRRWVRQRCRTATAAATGRLQHTDASAPLHERVTSWLFGTSLTALILLLAGLRPPTVRRRYAVVRDLLHECGRPDFHEELLQLLGCSDWSRSQAEKHLDAVANAFDRAKRLPKGDFRFAADISQTARPVAIDGSRELIEQGLHREAVFWMVATSSRCQWVLHFNGPTGKGDRHRQGFQSMLSDLGIGDDADLETRRSQALEFLPRVNEMGEAVMAVTPEIE